MSIAIFTFSEDLHGHLVAEQIAQLGHRCHLVFTDQLAFKPWLQWRGSSPDASLVDHNNTLFNCSELTTIWWRRVNAPLSNNYNLADDAAYKLIPGECRAALLGAMFTAFTGRWVNDPSAELRADNKLVQLQAAAQIGFEVPSTLVSCIPDAIREFVAEQGGQVVVKVIRGLAEFSVPARVITADEITDIEALTACPSIWQAIVVGDTHLRVHVFGRQVIAVQITSEKLDWRPDLCSPMTEYPLNNSLKAQCQQLIKVLQLTMGIIDIKLKPDGTPVFLEVNPQGQFAFVEAITGLPLSRYMAEFLIDR
ncbi:ATP-grasp domain-containing protein [Gilvimarinus polysaccharolyticus]|uniref:ATP-grasp domain-containing protein n=1 Tax=Gilvimarinus polysaccharolyticus TaxID=863921 RepID=UPI0006738A42|nr:hypothetical protein [Gilvimarinus polysaccharolyticus]